MRVLRWNGHDTGARFLNAPLYRSELKVRVCTGSAQASADALFRATSAPAPLAQTSGRPSGVAVHNSSQSTEARGKSGVTDRLKA